MIEMNLQSNNHNYISAINVLFNTLRLNSNVNHYKEIWNIYQTAIRFIIDRSLPRMKYEFRLQSELTSKESGIIT